MDIETLKKKYKGVVRSASEVRDHHIVSLGPLSLNYVLGSMHGAPAGRLVQIVGKESSGKSTLAFDIIAQHQHDYPNMMIIYLDYERTYDPIYAAACGINTETMLLLTPNSAEEGADMVEEFIRTGEVKLVILDSIPAAIPRTEHDKTMTDSPKMASSAGFITRFVQRIAYQLDNYDVMFIAINQLRMNFSAMSPERYVPFGGMALQYATSIRIDLERIKNENDQQTIRAFIKKSKVGSPRGMTEFKIVYGQGIDHAGDILTLATQFNIVRQSGAWFTYGDIKCQGMANARQQMPLEEIKEKILELQV